MHPYVHATTAPDKPAFIMSGTGHKVTYRELDESSNRIAHLIRACGLKRGDNLAVFLPNVALYYPIAWAAQRTGLYLTAISSRLTSAEAEYIIRDAGSRMVVTSGELGEAAAGLASLAADAHLFMIDGQVPGFQDFEAAIRDLPPVPVEDESPGAVMLYSSGTTGRPKGVRHPLPDGPVAHETNISELFASRYGGSSEMIYLSPAPLYHAAPLIWGMSVHRLGGTVIVMEKFEAEAALKAIQDYRATHAQWVPTHFVRMLKLPEEVRARYDVSSLKVAFHAAAPCPVPIKEQMINWWGPIIHEYYGGTENCGGTFITPQEWLTHKGSVGRAANCVVHICGPDGEELPAGEEGLVYLEGGNPFSYHNDPAKTAESFNARGWATLGDIGRLDEEGYLYLTDRKSFMIISGGVNIYPQEIENLLITHPKVADVAVVGAPDDDMGERVVAVVQPANWEDAGDALAEELDRFCRAQLSGVKRPRQIDFMAELPRHATGKLYKRILRDRYWGKESRIV